MFSKYILCVIYIDNHLSYEDVYIYPSDSTPYGQSYSEWSIRWWKWALSIPKKTNPTFDLTGAYAHIDQNEKDVFYLCQTFERLPIVPIRKITIPFGKAVFMPIINWISVIPQDGINENQLVATAKRKIDAVENLKVLLNYKELNIDYSIYRIRSATFKAYLPNDNILNVNDGYCICLSDGYWLLFKSLKRHLVLSTYGSCSLGVTKITINYTLDYQ